ncbi:MAG: HAD-IIIA family hydrolase [Candidatus Accumulibacter sp.]|jgi:phosphoglycolate phosphatase|nr:HAD-IIIA family hydrolase [Accumulibacter sp.]
MVRRFELLVFDWDGTLYDSTGNIVWALRAACRDLGVPEPSEAESRYVIGLELSQALRHIVPGISGERLPSLVAAYRRRYLEADRELRLFEGIAELVEALSASGHRLAVATGKSRAGLSRALADSGLEPYFAASRCADECFSKPHPQMLEQLMDEFAVSRGQTLMIGDTTHDLQMAGNAGVAGLAVTYGAHTREALSRLDPLACVEDVEQLALWLKRNA